MFVWIVLILRSWKYPQLLKLGAQKGSIVQEFSLFCFFFFLFIAFVRGKEGIITLAAKDREVN